MKKFLSMLLVAAMTISMVTVVSFAEEETVAKIGDTSYPTLAAAVEAVVDDTETTIVLTGDTKGSGVVIPSGRNITIDLNTFTYDVGNPTVGSVGTETNGFQLLKNSNITIKNGTITSQEAKFLIQNYSNLTLDTVTLDGSKLKEAAANYTLSNNCGHITINDSTIIADTDAADFAFDVCDYSVYTGVTVTVTGDSRIDGNIEITNPNGGENNAKLVVEGGSFTDIATAIENAENGATVKVLPNVTITEEIHPMKGDSQHKKEKSITIIGAEDGTSVLTGGMIIGYDDCHTHNNTITIKNLIFKGKGLAINDEKNVVIENNIFEDIVGNAISTMDQTYADMEGTVHNGSVTIKGNKIDGTTEAGILVDDGYDVTIIGNEISNTDHNAILLAINETTAPRYLNAGEVTITDNTLKNWDANNDSDGGRAIRANLGKQKESESISKKFVFANNSMIKTEWADEPEDPNFVKITYTINNDETGIVTANLNGNYWNSTAPDFSVVLNGNVSADTIENYYLDAELENLVVTSDASTEVSEDIDPTVKDEITTDANKTDIKGIEADTIDKIAESVDVDNATSKLTEEGVEVGGDVKIFVKPSLDVTVTEVKVEEGKTPVIALDINLYSQAIATTADSLSDVDTEGDGKNAVLIGEKTTMTTTEAVTITVPIGATLAAALGETTVMVKHIKDDKVYYYPATLNDNNTITFTNPHGFSIFEICEADTTTLTIKFDGRDRDGNAIFDIENIDIYDIGTELELTDAYKSGYRFDGWCFGDDDEEYNDTITLTEELWDILKEQEQDGVVTANPNFILERTSDRKGSTSGGIYVNYTIQFNTTGGSAIKDATVSKGAKVSEPAAPTKGDLVFDGWYTDRSFNTKYNFDSPVYSSFTLYAKWTSESATVFTDVKEGDWFFDVVNEAYTKGLMKGMGDGSFSPETDVTRGMFATVLYRIAGEPAITAPSGFADVDSGAYYANAIAWASESGIANGMTETEFMPERSITREQIATLLYRYAQMIGEDVSVGEDTNILSYGDFASISEYAIPAIQWACGSGMMQGYPEGVFMPQNSATRAETAAVFVRMLNTK